MDKPLEEIFILICDEPERLPPRTDLELALGDRFQVHLIADRLPRVVASHELASGANPERFVEGHPLRCIQITRWRETEVPTPGPITGGALEVAGHYALFTACLVATKSGNTHAALCTIVEMSGDWSLWIYDAGVSRRAVPGVQFRSGSRFELTVPALSLELDAPHAAPSWPPTLQWMTASTTRTFVLQVHRRALLGLNDAIGGIGLNVPIGAVLEPWPAWQVSDLTRVLEAPQAKVAATYKAVTAAIGKQLAKLKTPALMLLPYAVFATVAILIYRVTQDQRADDLNRIAALEQNLKAQEGALTVASASRSQALAEQQNLAATLANELLKLKVAVARAVDFAGARDRAVQRGGSILKSPATLRYDADQVDALATAIAHRILKEKPQIQAQQSALETCQLQSKQLDQGVPAWVLLWHPETTRFCPTSYEALYAGVPLYGRWGLSAGVGAFYLPDSATWESDAAGDAATGTDAAIPEALQEDAFSSQALSAGVLDVLDALGESSVRLERAACAPSLLEAWALALFSGYDTLPSPAAGSADAPAGACVSFLLDQLNAGLASRPPGEPILPELSALASSEKQGEDLLMGLEPTIECPWTAAGLQKAAISTLETLARATVLGAAASKSQ